MANLSVFDLQQNKIVEEKVYGGDMLRMFYSSYPLRFFLRQRLVQKGISHAVGAYKRHGRSKKTIDGFLKQYEMSLDEYEVPDGGFPSFNEFFIRKKKKFSFPEDVSIFPSPCDARLSVSRIEARVPQLKVKGLEISLPDLLGPLRDKGPEKGWALTFRLCPLDYHRFHFVDSGEVGLHVEMGTTLHSVNPWALHKLPKIFEWNERQITIQKTQNYGEVFYIEVGAMCVGRIHQTYSPNTIVQRGQEKGYFDFGGSTVVLIVPDGERSLKINSVITEKNNEGFEVVVRLGDELGRMK